MSALRQQSVSGALSQATAVSAAGKAAAAAGAGTAGKAAGAAATGALGKVTAAGGAAALAAYKTEIVYGVAALAVFSLLTVGGTFAVNHSGSPLGKQAVAENKRCQALLKAQNSKDYNDCQIKLDVIVNKLLETKEVNDKYCKPNPAEKNTALCSVMVWYKEQWFVTAVPSIVNTVNSSQAKS